MMTPHPSPPAPSRSLTPWLVLAGVLVATLWAYWTTLAEVARVWESDPSYSHGYLVPAFALLLLWLRRDRLTNGPLTPSAWGVPILLVGVVLRLVGGYYGYDWFDAMSLLPVLAGLCLMLGGRTAWRWAWPAIAFLFFMIPMPFTAARMMSDPLQRVATVSSTFLLQAFGVPALAEGKVILINESQINIVEACSGLRMMVIFFALSTGVALLTQRPLWEKLLIVGSAFPIALIANISRITATGLVHDWFGPEAAGGVFHDAAGWAMMPLGLALLALELKFLNHLWIEVKPPDTQTLTRGLQRRDPEIAPPRRRRKASVSTPPPLPGPSSA